MNPAKILAVDDEPDFELLLTQRFRRQIRAQEFAFAHHGEEALAVLEAEPDVDLLLLDINMPVMDGLTLLAELRARQADVRAMIVSAYGDMTNIRTAMTRWRTCTICSNRWRFPPESSPEYRLARSVVGVTILARRGPR